MKVSIVIATYGEQSWKELALERAYPSALDQGAHEVVVGHDTNATIATVRNELALHAEGDWLCFLDADDELAPGYLEAMEQVNSGITYNQGEYVLLTPAVSYVTKGRRRPAKFPAGTDITSDNFLVVGTLIQRDLFFKVEGFSDYPHGFEDWSLWAKAWKAGARIVQVKNAVYIAYIDPNSEHRRRWRDRRWQVDMHNKVRAELFP